MSWPDSARSNLAIRWPKFLQLVQAYALFNPHATFTIHHDKTTVHLQQTAATCMKWIAREPPSAHWYSADQLRALIAAYIAAERLGSRPRTVREFIAEFRGLSGTAKQKTILARLPIAGVHLGDFVRQGDVDRAVVGTLLDAMRTESRPVKPAALGILGEPHLRAWLEGRGGRGETFRYKRIADTDQKSGLPFVVEVAFCVLKHPEGKPRAPLENHQRVRRG